MSETIIPERARSVKGAARKRGNWVDLKNFPCLIDNLVWITYPDTTRFLSLLLYLEELSASFGLLS